MDQLDALYDATSVGDADAGDADAAASVDALYDAATAGDADAIAKLETEANRLYDEEYTILHVESGNGKTERVRFILREFANKNLLDKITTTYKETALHMAMYGGHTEVAEVIIEAARTHLSETSFRNLLRQGDKDMDTALHAAVMYGHVAIVKLLVEADPTHSHFQNNEGKTPIYIAMEKGFKDIVEIISTTCTAPLNFDGPGGITALHWAIYRGHTGVAEVIIEAARRYLPETSFQAFLRKGDKDMDTALHAAIMERNVAIVKLLVEADPTDRHTRNNRDRTPMYIAVEKGYNDIVELISTTCVAPSLEGPDGYTALPINNLDKVLSPGGRLYKIMDVDDLYAAAVAGEAEAIAKLEMRANILNDAEETILHIESRNGNTERVRFILREFANKNLLAKLAKYEHTALHMALRYGHTEVAEVIIDAARQHFPVPSFQAFLRRVDEYLNSALHLAVIKGRVDVVKLLIEADPTDTHTQNSEGETPIYIAADQGYTEIVKLICTSCTAPLNLDGPGGKHTALHAAIKSGNPGIELVEVLFNAARRLPSSASDNHITDSNPVTSFQTFLRRVDEDWNTALHLAVIKGRLGVVKLLVEADPTHTHTQNNEGKSPMYIAVERKYKEIVEIISTTCTAPLNFDGPGGSTALHAAVEYRNYNSEVVEVLIDAARSLLSSDSDPVSSFQAFLRRGDEDLNSALHIAVAQRNFAMAKLLVDADPGYKGSQNNEGQTPFYIAVIQGYSDIVTMMCTSTTCSDIVYVDGPGGSTTALHAAIKDRNHGIEVVKVLIDAARTLLSSDSDTSYAYGNPISSFQGFLRRVDKYGNCALHIALKKGNLATAELLIVADPSYPGFPNNEGKTPIYVALENGYTGIVKVICTTCKAPLNLNGPDGKHTALHAAVKNSMHDIEVLIDAARRLPSSDSLYTDGTDDDDISSTKNPVSPFQAFLRRVDEHGNTALQIAVVQHNLVTATLLLEADPSYEGSRKVEDKTPFYIAVERGYADIVKMMCTTSTAPLSLLYGPGPDHRSYTALHAVIKNLDEAKNEVRDVMKIIIDRVRSWLITRNGDMDEQGIHKTITDRVFCATDEEDQTLLELAVERNYLEVVELILNVGNPACKDGWIGDDFISLMPLIYEAKDKEYHKIVELLTKKYEAGAKLSELSIHLRNQASMISAIRSHQKESASDLLENYAENLVLFYDKLGWTLLHHAAYNEFNSIITRIVEEQKRFGHGFEYPDLVSTPFHVAAEKGYTYIVILLMQLWPSWSSAYTAVDKNGQNILHLAALQSNKKMIQGILKHCPEEHKKKFVNQEDKDGNTPLHLLIRGGCLVAQLLTYNGVDTMLKNKKSCTPLDMLYVEDDIIEDQVKIKIALDHIQFDQKRDVFPSSELSVTKREKKDEKFKKQAQQMIDKKLAWMKEDTRAVANCFADAISGDPIARAALEMEADTLNEAGETILHVESKKGVLEKVRYIVSAFANKNLLDKLDNQKQTALYLAAHHGRTQVVEALLSAAKLNMPSSSANDDTHYPVTPFQAYIRQANVPNQNTPLHAAVLRGDVAIVKLLVEADPNDRHVCNNECKTPIFIAADKGYKEIIQEICTSCRGLSLDGPGGRTTALHVLIQNVGQVIEGGSNVIGMMVVAAKRWSTSAEFEELFGRTDESGSTLLQLAVERNCVDVVKLILENDPAYQYGREIKRNGLMRLIYKAIDNRYSDGIVKLLSQTYQVGISPEHRNALELILAIKRRDEDSVLRLLETAKDLVTFAEDNKWTALHYAVYHEFDSVLGAIIGAQEDVKHQFVYEIPTPFHVAVECGYTSTLVRLMQLWPVSSSVSEANSPYTVVNKDCRNILHLAAADNGNTKVDNRKEMVEGILKYCPEEYKDTILKQKDTNDDTPLHVLISEGCFIPELMKDEGLGTTEKNKNNFTPWEMLYLKNDVVADQVHIKIAIDDVESYQSSWNLWHKRKKNKKDIWKNIPPSKRRTKDVIFDEQKQSLMNAKHLEKKEKLERYKMRTNTQIIVTALITTVTFTVGFTMPGGLRQSGEVDEGLVLLSKKKVFNAFMISDALALLLSTSSLFFYFCESMIDDPLQVSKLSAASTVLNIISVMAMMLTFITGTYLVLSHSLALAITVCILGSIFFLLVIILSIKIVYDRLHVKRNLD